MNGSRGRRFLIPIALGVVLVVADVAGIVVKGRSAGVDPGTLWLVIPACFGAVAAICGLGLWFMARARKVRTSALSAMFPDAVIANVSDRPGDQLYRFRSLVRDKHLVTRRQLSRTNVSIVVDGIGIQGWTGGARPRRAFLIPKSAIRSISVGEFAATPVLMKPAMKVVLDYCGIGGDVYFLFGGGTSRNSWSLMDADQTEAVVREAQVKLGFPVKK